MAETQALKSLHTTLIDAQEGYKTAIADAKAPDMKALFQSVSDLHARAHSQIQALLLEAGEKPDESGSFLQLVHKTAISVRSAVAGLDRSSLSSFIDGEERIVKSYDEAIAEAGPNGETGRVLQRHRDALTAEIQRMRALAT